MTNIKDPEIKKTAYKLLKIKFQDFPKDNKCRAR
jgi:hypothetical protein